MPVIVNATPKSSTANSFTTLGEANIYNAGVVGAEGWVDFEMDARNRALVTATNIIASNVRFRGTRTDKDQALPWPRIGVYDNDGFYVSSELIPFALKNATAELARRLLESASGSGGGGASDPLLASIKSFKAGPVDVTFRDDATITTEALPTDVFRMISHLTVQASGSGVRAVRVIRT